MRSPIGSTRRTAALVAVIALSTACSSGGSGDETGEPVAGVPSGTVAIPPERLTPFCQAMIDLSDTLETDPPADIDAYIIETYTDITGDVPGEIAVVFEAVLAELRGEPPAAGTDDRSTSTPSSTQPTSTLPRPRTSSVPDGSGPGQPPEGDAFFEEGYLPGDDPAEQLNAYVDFACRDSQNNPGPPATQPLDDILPPTTES